MDVESVFLRSPRQLPKKLCDMLLLIDTQIVLPCSEEADASLAYGDGKVLELFVPVGSVVDLFELGICILTPNDRCDIHIFEVVDGATFLERLSPELIGVY